MSAIYDEQEATILRACEVLEGMQPYLDAGLYPPPQFGSRPIAELLPSLRRLRAAIYEKHGLNNLTGEAQDGR